MQTFILKGDWEAKAYRSREAVKYGSYYYRALTDVLSTDEPTVSLKWALIPPYASVMDDPTPYTYDELVGAFTEPWDVDNGKGLYMFPDKKLIDTVTDETELHFHKMGLKLMYEYALEYYNANIDIMPNITGIYIVHGDRKKNIITQGFSVASVEGVGFSMKFLDSDDTEHAIYQTTKLGNKSNDSAFPILGAGDYRMFPIIKISRGRKGDEDNDTQVWRMEEDAMSDLLVMPKTESIFCSATRTDEFKLEYGYTLLKPSLWLTTYHDMLKNISTNKYCIYTPDIILDKSITIPNNVYIKPVKKINYNINSDLGLDTDAELTDEKKISSAFHIGKNNDIGDTNQALYISSRSIYINPDLSTNVDGINYVELDVNTRSVFSTNAVVVNENIYNGEYGFSTRLRSLIDIFGYDYKQSDQDQSTTIDSYFSASRQQLYDAGILINRTKWSVEDNENEHPIFGETSGSNLNNYKKYPFGFSEKRIYGFSIAQDADKANNNKSLFVVATNPSMRSLPYIGIKTSYEGKYSTLASLQVASTQDSDSGLQEKFSLDDYRALHNTIVNICLFKNYFEYIDSVLSEFSVINEDYKVVDYTGFDKFMDQIDTILYKGDVFSQKTFMRAIHWDSIPEVLSTPGTNNDWSYSWKFGQAFNIYLQSLTNTYLRVPENDSMFYPYVLRFYNNAQDAIDNFIWKNTSTRYLKETWQTNDGYHKLKSLWQLQGYDELLMKLTYQASNRIYASNVHVGGSIVDQYRDIPIGQYADYNFEGGDIMTLAKYNNTLFSIQRYSINQHIESQRLEQADDSSTIITGDRSVLTGLYRQLETYGTQHKESVVIGQTGLYGIDWDKEKLWRIKGEYSATGNVYFQCENLIESKTLYDIFKIIKKDNQPLIQDLYGVIKSGIISSYDEENKQILFTVHINDEEYYTFAFSEELDAFIGFFSYDVNYYMKFDNRLLSFMWGSNKDNTSIQELNKGRYLEVNGSVEPLVLSFIINGLSEAQNASQFEKEFQSHLINSSSEKFDMVSWETEWQESEKNPFINEAEFWSNPEYKEHLWRVPVIPNQKNPVEGPLGSTTFSTFETNSAMRGQWIKVTLKYIPKNIADDIQFYIKNVITNFLISYS